MRPLLKTILAVGLLLPCLVAGLAIAAGQDHSAAVMAVDGESQAQRAQAIAQLRRSGPAGLAELLAAHPDLLAAAIGPTPSDNPRVACFVEACDAVAAQKDAAFSGVFWFTDYDDALREARRTGRPILSLRLLGQLTDELSCANSRFFRVGLYANEQISADLRDHWVLYWSSERPVPVVTVDFGDGNVVRRTVTGNSIHYILKTNGQVIDALPGLYGPGAFLSRLVQLRTTLATRTEPVPLVAGKADRRRVNTMAKTVAEFPVNRMLGEPVVLEAQAVGDRLGDDASMQARATALLPDCRLDARSRTLFARKTAAKSDALLQGFETLLSQDTARNDVGIRPIIQGWILAGRKDFATLNANVYSKLFNTPADQPLLGLEAHNAFTAIDPAIERP